MNYAETARDGMQVFEDSRPEGPNDTVGCPLSVISAQNHASGQAMYTDDMPPFKSKYKSKMLLLILHLFLFLPLFLQAKAQMSSHEVLSASWSSLHYMHSDCDKRERHNLRVPFVQMS